MKKFVLIFFISISGNIYAEKIIAKIAFNIKEQQVLGISVNTDNKEKKEKCENQIRSQNGKYMMKMITRNKKEELIILTFMCVV